MSLAAFAASFGFLASQYLANAASSGAAVCGGWIVPSTAAIATSATPARIGAFYRGSGLQTGRSRCQAVASSRGQVCKPTFRGARSGFLGHGGADLAPRRDGLQTCPPTYAGGLAPGKAGLQT